MVMVLTVMCVNGYGVARASGDAIATSRALGFVQQRCRYRGGGQGVTNGRAVALLGTHLTNNALLCQAAGAINIYNIGPGRCLWLLNRAGLAGAGAITAKAAAGLAEINNRIAAVSANNFFSACSDAVAAACTAFQKVVFLNAPGRTYWTVFCR